MANNTDWLEISQMSGGTGMTPLSLTALTNSSLQPKTATITARNTQYNVSDTTTVTIQGFQPTLTLSTSTLRFDSTGGTATFTVYSNTAWTIDFPYLVYDYSTSAGTGDTEVTIVLDQNLDTVSKVQVGTVRDIFGVNELSLTIVQEAFIHQLTVTPDDDIVFDNTGSTTSLTIDSNCDWVIYTSSWMRLSVNSGTSGTTTVLVTALQNGPEDREGVIAIYYGNKEILINAFQPFYIPDHITVTPSAYTFPYSASEATFVVDSFPGWTCEVVTTGETIWAADTYMEAIFDIPSAMTMPAYTGNSGSTTAIYIGPIKHYGSSVTFESGGTYRIRYEMPSGGTTPVLQGNQYLKEVTITDNVGAIQSSAFTGCSALSSVTIGSGLTRVGNGAFSGCSSLDFIKITAPTAPSIGSNTFYGVATGGTLKYPEESNYNSWLSPAAYYLGYYGWPGFSGKTYMTVEYNVTSTTQPTKILESNTIPVDYTDIFSKVTLEDGEIIFDYAGGDNFNTGYTFSETGNTKLRFYPITSTIPDGDRYVNSCFMDCTAITSVELSDTTIYLGGCFGGCSSLSSITFNNMVEHIGGMSNLPALTGISMPDSVTGFGGFGYCASLRTIRLSANINSFSEGAFRSCASLTGITIPSSVQTLPSYCFYGCTSLATVNLSNVTNIGERCFNGCRSLGPQLVLNGTILSAACFSGCTGIQQLYMRGISNIPPNAFRECSSLYYAYFDEDLSSINNRAFQGCSSLTSMTSMAAAAPTVDWDSYAFADIARNGILYYPAGKNYDTWLSTELLHLGASGWTGEEINIQQ